MREREHSHPSFARVYGLVAAVGERTGYGRWRAAALTGARGRLLVLGLGPGHDLDHLPPAVTAVVAVEPDPAMRARAGRRIARARPPVLLVAAEAERLPLADGSVDAVLCALVLCSVADLAGALAEVRRVLRPGGTLHLLEHVRAADGSRLAAVQDRLDPLWGRLAGGCSVTRRTRAAVEAAGFDTAAVVSRTLRPAVLPIGPHLRGVARVR
jgi:SAM-dependent methyltransferase